MLMATVKYHVKIIGIIVFSILTNLVYPSKPINTKEKDSTETSSIGRHCFQDTVHLILLRGLTRETGHWGETIIIEFKEYFPNAIITYLDLPGSGVYVDSVSPKRVEKMVDFMRHDIIKIINDTINPKFLIATSMGGMLGYDWLKRYPKDFDGLVMVTSTFKKICKFKDRVNPRMWGKMIRIFLKTSVYKRERIVVEIDSNHPEIYDSVSKAWGDIQMKRRMSRKNIYRQTMAGMKYKAEQIKVTKPLLLVGTKGDRMVCVDCIDKMHVTFGGDLVWHPNSGHGIPLDEPIWLCSEISHWIISQISN